MPSGMRLHFNIQKVLRRKYVDYGVEYLGTTCQASNCAFSFADSDHIRAGFHFIRRLFVSCFFPPQYTKGVGAGLPTNDSLTVLYSKCEHMSQTHARHTPAYPLTGTPLAALRSIAVSAPQDVWTQHLPHGTNLQPTLAAVLFVACQFQC